MTRVTVWFSNVDQESKRSFRRGRNTTSARHLGCKVWENAPLQASTGASIVAAVFRVELWPLAVCANRPPTAPRHVEATQTHHTREPSRCHKHTCARTDTITATMTSRASRDTEAFIVQPRRRFSRSAGNTRTKSGRRNRPRNLAVGLHRTAPMSQRRTRKPAQPPLP